MANGCAGNRRAQGIRKCFFAAARIGHLAFGWELGGYRDGTTITTGIFTTTTRRHDDTTDFNTEEAKETKDEEDDGFSPRRHDDTTTTIFKEQPTTGQND